MCPDCIAVKDKPLTYAICEVCRGWRTLTQEEMKKTSCLDENGNIIKSKWASYRKANGGSN